MKKAFYHDRVAVIGGGRALKQFLKLLEALEKNAHSPVVEIVAVADPNPEAPGLEYAKRKGIPTYDHYQKIMNIENLSMVMELTGHEELIPEIQTVLPKGVSMIDHRAAMILWNLLSSVEKRVSRLRNEAHSQRLAAVEEMATYIAHEMRNPLMALGGYAQSLISVGCLEDGECLARGRVIVEEVRRLESVLRNIWDLTRPLEMKRKSSDFNVIVKESIDLLNQDWDETGIKLDLIQEPDIPSVPLDPFLIKQACLNIIKNAVESMPRGGRLAILTELSWDHLLFRLSDQGSGIPPEVMDDIFNPFFTTKEGALGLGLAMTKKIIEDHDGEIKVTARENTGTTVEFRLPLDSRKLLSDFFS